MALADRLPRYAAIESIRERPLIVYVTSNRPHAGALMAVDVIPEFADHLTCIPEGTKAVDLMIVSNGGDPTVAWRVMSLLRERFDTVGVLVPQAAFSAATLLALGADEIVMHPHGNLGPVDPQFVVPKPAAAGAPAQSLRFGYEELAGFFEFAKGEGGITDQEHLRALFTELTREVSAVGLGAAARGSRLSLSMGEQLLKMHMTGPGESDRATEIAQRLNKNFAHHGYPLSRREAREVGLKIADPQPTLEKEMWEGWLDIEQELEVRRPFSVFSEIAANAAAGPSIFDPAPTVQIPANLPPNVLQQAYNQVLQQIQVVKPPPIEYRITHALLEGTRHASANVTKGRILAVRTPDNQVNANMIPLETGWVKISLPTAGGPP